MTRNIEDLTGQRFGRLVAIEFSKRENGRDFWRCLCDCGKEIVTMTSTLKIGRAKSCGCSRVADLTGMRFNRLLVLSRAENNVGSRDSRWNCICDCGNICIAMARGLRNGDNLSCGCYNREIVSRIKRIKEGEAAFRLVYRTYLIGASNRNLSFELNEDIFRDLTSKECSYCGRSPNRISRNKGNNGEYIYNGLDRVDNSRGYEIDNVVPCCWDCNRMKGDMSREEFFVTIKRIYNYSIKDKEITT
jgi:hypothetical protein